MGHIIKEKSNYQEQVQRQYNCIGLVEGGGEGTVWNSWVKIIKAGLVTPKMCCLACYCPFDHWNTVQYFRKEEMHFLWLLLSNFIKEFPTSMHFALESDLFALCDYFCPFLGLVYASRFVWFCWIYESINISTLLPLCAISFFL